LYKIEDINNLYVNLGIFWLYSRSEFANLC